MLALHKVLIGETDNASDIGCDPVNLTRSRG